ncbi:MAG: type II toxin-antitoxin system RelE/ParE family toxin [Proteobacteria bacterium]|nr:type II toxin-antitoxin system RelE/ParE family toxin [Pseudomonadota bacterium]
MATHDLTISPAATEDLLPDTRSLLVEEHVIFCRIHHNRVEVIRILHGRQDVRRHL